MEENQEKDREEEPMEEINANDTSLSLFFGTKEEKILVESAFELIRKEQAAASIPDGLVSFAKIYGKHN
jgi:hypothetical protein